jgi:glyoxylase-like metal-dependent hydrolase (beta-lactamase superfamily II)
VLVVGFPAGPWGTNCYLVATAAGEQCLIVDPGKDSMPGIEDVIREHRLSPVAVLLTHGHIDHVWSVVPVCGAKGIPAYLHPDDRGQMAEAHSRILGEASNALAELTGGSLRATEPDDLRELADGLELEVAGLRLTAVHAPGHTEGSVMFSRPAEGEMPPLLLSGDVLFEGSIGRTDLPGGDHAAMLESLRAKVLPLDDDTVVLPGHGASTTIGRERVANPYLSALVERGSTVAPKRGM